MVFSRFTKKDNEPSKTVKPAAAKPGAAKPAAPARPAAPLSPSAKATVDKIDQIEAEMMELDFTALPAASPAPPPPPPPPPAAAAPAPSGDGEMDFTKPLAPAAAPAPAPTPAPAPPAAAISASDLFPAAAPADKPAAPGKPQIEHGFNPTAKPAASRPAAPAAAKPAAPAPAAAKPAAPAPAAPPAAPKNAAPPPPQGVSSVMMMEVQQSPFEAAPALEEAAILYANRQDEMALAALEDAVNDTKIPAPAQRQAWMLLFDLYENLGQKEAFETKALDFAVRFETSPPAFNDRSKLKDPSLMTGGGQYFSFTGHLDNNAGKQFEQLKKVAAKDSILRIEFGKIDTIAAEGATTLMAFLKEYKKTGNDLIFSNADHLIKLLSGMIETGRKEDPEAFWLLLLDLYQLQYMQTAFEETALNYCITYEVSPPSWVEPKKPPANTPAPAPTTYNVPQDAFYFKGEVEGGSEDLLKSANEYAADKARVVFDVFDVKRIDFIAAGNFLNLVSALRGQDKRIEIRNPSPLIGALLLSMGFTSQVHITKRSKS